MKKMIKIYILSIYLILPALAIAHGPSRVLLKEQIEINASPTKVWSIISDFCSIKDWHPSVTDCTINKANEAKLLRVITLQNGEKIEEILAKHKPEKFILQHYMKDSQQLKSYPITTHSLTITIVDNDQGGSTMTWKGAFYRSFQGPNPPPELSDETATKKLTVFYRDGLENIKRISE